MLLFFLTLLHEEWTDRAIGMTYWVPTGIYVALYPPPPRRPYPCFSGVTAPPLQLVLSGTRSVL